MRDLSQLLALLLSIMIIVTAIISCFTAPSKKYSHILWMLFGVVGLIYSVISLSDGQIGHDLSPHVRAAERTLVATWLVLWLRRDIQRLKDKK